MIQGKQFLPKQLRRLENAFSRSIKNENVLHSDNFGVKSRQINLYLASLLIMRK